MSVKLAMRNRDNVQLGYAEAQTGGYIIFLPNGDTYHVCSADFREKFTPLPEAPEVGSLVWALWMTDLGIKVKHITWGDVYLVKNGCFYEISNGESIMFVSSEYSDWQLYAPPKPIVECLPHEFVKYDKILWRNWVTNRWTQGRFIEMAENGVEYICDWPHVGVMNRNHFHHFVIPYAGNEHLEGQITDDEHGAVPRGYVPPYVPQLGDETYWQTEDVIVNLSSNAEAVVSNVSEKKIEIVLSEGRFGILSPNGAVRQDFLRVWYHKGSYVREDGTVHEHVPTRPHRIETCTTCDGTDDVESCAYCKDNE